VFEVRWLCSEFSKNQARTRHFKLYYEIRTIRLYEDATVEEQGKVSSCYEKNISQDTTCRKIFMIACTEKILSCLGMAEIFNSVLN
jgi:hypothetical protein